MISNYSKFARVVLKKTTLLRKLMKEHNILVAAGGTYDCISARLVEKAGFQATTITGAGFQASLLGMPDVGILTMTEMVNHARNIANSVNIPVLVDADQGYGGIVSLRRMIRELEKAGIAGLSIQDYQYPKPATGNLVIPVEEMLIKIKAAMASREDPDFVICARTESATISFSEMVKRCNLYADAGVDLVKPILPRPRNFKAFESLANGVKFPMWFSVDTSAGISSDDLLNIGIKGIATYLGGPSLLNAALRAMKSLLTEGRKGVNGERPLAELTPVTHDELEELMGLPDIIEFERQFLRSRK
jgi:2-methylisocitrate lyase-like PEP mutase family enzyme